MKAKLNVATVAALVPSEGRNDDIAWDVELEGFGCRVKRGPNGLRRSYVVQYRNGGGRTRRVTFGSADKLTPTQARARAKQILAKVQLGHDPQLERTTRRRDAGQTFIKIAAAYLAAKKDALAPVSHRIFGLYLSGSYARPLHNMAIRDVSRGDIAARLNAISQEHSSNTADAVRGKLSALFTWAIQQGFRDDNPVLGTARPERSKPRERVLTDGELAAIWNACGDDEFGRVTRLLMLTGCRRSEVGGMCWSEFDFDQGTWTLPAERSKNGRALTLTLPPAAIAIVQAVQNRGRDQLFGDRAAGFTSWDPAKQALDERLGDAVKPWRLHDLRRTAATGMADLGIEPHIIEAVLNHHSGHRAGVAGVYNRSAYTGAVKVALTRWTDHVLALAEGRVAADNVVTLRA
jgi:integrase